LASNYYLAFQFCVNDEIYVTERLNKDWLRGTIGLRQGIFPVNYVQEITSPRTEISSSLTENKNPTPKFVTAAYDYNSVVDGDLIFKAVPRTYILTEDSSTAQNQIYGTGAVGTTGRLHEMTGLVPRTYILTEDSSTAQNQVYGTGMVGTIVTATRDYYNVASDHLCFSKGDQIEVIEEVNSSWLKGRLLLNMCNVKSFPIGLFPRSAIL
uniref:SH3 domain-containing protein n=1 Tax=Gongylonema pulchrum TaxID=637853 RepID=A0A183E073_9BILA